MYRGSKSLSNAILNWLVIFGILVVQVLTLYLFQRVIVGQEQVKDKLQE